jgi:hypothetical protein
MENISESIRKYLNVIKEHDKNTVNELFGIGKKSLVKVGEKLVADLAAKGINIELLPDTTEDELKIRGKLSDGSKITAKDLTPKEFAQSGMHPEHVGPWMKKLSQHSPAGKIILYVHQVGLLNDINLQYVSMQNNEAADSYVLVMRRILK